MNVFGIDMYVIMSVVLLLGLTLPYVFQKIRQQKDVNKYNITNWKDSINTFSYIGPGPQYFNALQRDMPYYDRSTGKTMVFLRGVKRGIWLNMKLGTPGCNISIVSDPLGLHQRIFTNVCGDGVEHEKRFINVDQADDYVSRAYSIAKHQVDRDSLGRAGFDEKVKGQLPQAPVRRNK